MKLARILSGGILVACIMIGTAHTAMAVEILSGPTLTMDPNRETPLAGVVEMETDEPVSVQLTISGDGDIWTATFPATQVHYCPVLGMKPNRTYTVKVSLITSQAVVVFAGNLTAVTPPLPVDFPLLSVTSEPAKMEPGFHFLDCFSRGGDPEPTYSFIVDSVGDVVWYTTICIRAVRKLPNGNLFYIWGGAVARESDMLGNVKLYVPTEYENSLHHDLLRTPDGKYLSLDRETVIVDDYPTSTEDRDAPTETTDIRDDPVVEFLPDGTLGNKWFTTDLLDPTRIGYFSLRNTSLGKDWGHANAVTYVPEDNSIIVSVRHQEAVIKFSRATGDLIWILGDHYNWPPELQPYLLHPVNTPFRWQFAQHAPMLTGEGNLLLFDNGNNRALPFDGNPVVPDEENFSRAVEYAIDEENKEVEQVWEFGEFIEEPIYSRFISDADWQPTTGNVVVHFGGVSYTGGVASADLGLGVNHVRIIEVTRDTPPDIVFDLTVYNPTGSITIYRSERIQSLYPQRYILPPNGVGNTLVLDKAGTSADLFWAASSVDASHDAPDYYSIYVSESPDGGFSILDTSLLTKATADSGATPQYFKISAANGGGTSGDEPPGSE